MTPRETVLAKYPEALAKCVQPEAHALESYERRMHWEVYAGPAEDSIMLGVSLTEDSAWAEAAMLQVSNW